MNTWGLICGTIITALFLSSCGLVDNLHKQMDAEEGVVRDEYGKQRDPFERFRADKNNVNQYSRLSTKDIADHSPIIKRNYKPVLKRRYKADDLLDQGNDGSLWSSEGQRNFFFAKNKDKHYGDIVIIQVYERLKNAIAAELSRVTPKIKKKKKEGAATAAAADGPAPASAGSGGGGDSDKVYDKISTVVVEEVNSGLILIKGKKDVIYRAKKRTVEIQALVARRDIKEDDTLPSANIIERTIRVLR